MVGWRTARLVGEIVSIVQGLVREAGMPDGSTL
jgi:hypothetical protein